MILSHITVYWSKYGNITYRTFTHEKVFKNFLTRVYEKDPNAVVYTEKEELPF